MKSAALKKYSEHISVYRVAVENRDLTSPPNILIESKRVPSDAPGDSFVETMQKLLSQPAKVGVECSNKNREYEGSWHAFRMLAELEAKTIHAKL